MRRVSRHLGGLALSFSREAFFQTLGKHSNATSCLEMSIYTGIAALRAAIFLEPYSLMDVAYSPRSLRCVESGGQSFKLIYRAMWSVRHTVSYQILSRMRV